MRRKLEIEMQAGIFIFIGLAVIMITILMMGGGQGIFEKSFRVHVEVSDTAGLSKGGVVRSGGVKIGQVDEIRFSDNYENVRITLKINESYHQRLREDSLVRFQTQGVLGDKYIEVIGGTSDKPVIADGATIGTEQSKDLSAVFAEGSNALSLLKDNLANLKVLTSSMAKSNQMDKIMHDMAETSANLKEITKQVKTSNAMVELGTTMKNLRLVTDKMKNGEGTVGALLTDATLYEDLKNLIGGANRNNVLKFFVRQAVKSSDEAAAKADDKKADAKKK